MYELQLAADEVAVAAVVGAGFDLGPGLHGLASLVGGFFRRRGNGQVACHLGNDDHCVNRVTFWPVFRQWPLRIWAVRLGGKLTGVCKDARRHSGQRRYAVYATCLSLRTKPLGQPALEGRPHGAQQHAAMAEADA